MARDELITWIGLIAGTCTTISFVPQVYRIWRTKRAEDVSAHMFLIFTFGVSLWLVYGLSISSTPVTVSNAVTLMLSSLVLILKWKYRPRE